MQIYDEVKTDSAEFITSGSKSTQLNIVITTFPGMYQIFQNYIPYAR